MTLKPNQLKAVAWYCETLDLRPEMSVIPTSMRFTNKKTGEVVSTHLRNITMKYEAQREKAGKIRA